MENVSVPSDQPQSRIQPCSVYTIVGLLNIRINHIADSVGVYHKQNGLNLSLRTQSIPQPEAITKISLSVCVKCIIVHFRISTAVMFHHFLQGAIVKSPNSRRKSNQEYKQINIQL